MSRSVQIPVARIFKPLLDPYRYRAAWGGRGSGKSTFFSDLLVKNALLYPGFFAVCLREYQTTLRDSSKRTLELRLAAHGLDEDDGFRILHDRIETPSGGMITFRGMADANASSIKSLESANVAFFDEAENMSERSLELLRPTIRGTPDGLAEIWFAWNPRRATDPVDKFLRGEQLPTNAKIVKALWSDNPWWSKIMEGERLDDLRLNPDIYPHIWEGEYVSAIKGAYFARELANARRENRVTRLAKDPLMAHKVFVDIGGTGRSSDACAMWVMQFVGREIRVLDYYEVQGQPLSAHINWLQAGNYLPANTHIYLPHDGLTHDRVFNVSYDSEFRRAGYATTVTPNQGAGAAMQRIAACRKIFPSVLFHVERCAPGLDALGWYHERRDEHREIGLGPEHDFSSHAADAFGLMAIQAEDIIQAGMSIGRTRKAVKSNNRNRDNAWMS